MGDTNLEAMAGAVTWYIVQARPYHDWETQCASFDPVIARQQAREVRERYGTAPVRIVEVELPGRVIWVGDRPSRAEIVRPSFGPGSER
jgi:hypothetical protein